MAEELRIKINKAIAKFDGYELINLNTEDPEDSDFDCWVFKNKSSGKGYYGGDMQIFHSNSIIDYDYEWYMLMEVVDKIEKLDFTVTISYSKKSTCHQTIITKENEFKIDHIASGSSVNDKRESIWLAIANFIEWYNKNSLDNI